MTTLTVTKDQIRGKIGKNGGLTTNKFLPPN